MPKKSPIGEVIIDLTEIDSTNNYAMRLLNEGMAEDGVIIRADFQTAGRGQLGNVWQAEESKNLLMSVILDTSDFSLEEQFFLNAATCISIADCLMSQYNLRDVSIKWPNDIYAGNQKIAGILIENNIRGHQWTNAILGIGLNVNQTHFQDLSRATSLQLQAGKTFKVNQVLKAIVKSLNAHMKMLEADPRLVLRTYNHLLMGAGSSISFYRKHQLEEGILLGANEQGLLEVKQGDKTRRFKHKEIELVV